MSISKTGENGGVSVSCFLCLDTTNHLTNFTSDEFLSLDAKRICSHEEVFLTVET